MDFIKATQAVLEMSSTPVHELITLAPSGGGKSYLAGTTGLKTLYIYGLGEQHGFKSAKLAGGENILPFCLMFQFGTSTFYKFPALPPELGFHYFLCGFFVN